MVIDYDADLTVGCPYQAMLKFDAYGEDLDFIYTEFLVKISNTDKRRVYKGELQQHQSY